MALTEQKFCIDPEAKFILKPLTYPTFRKNLFLRVPSYHNISDFPRKTRHVFGAVFEISYIVSHIHVRRMQYSKLKQRSQNRDRHPFISDFLFHRHIVYVSALAVPVIIHIILIVNILVVCKTIGISVKVLPVAISIRGNNKRMSV